MAAVKTMVGPYEVKERIGKGSFATVWRGAHSTTNEKVAIKGINLQKANIKETACINSEISILRALNHPNIVRLLDFQRTRRHIYLIMEYCSGGDLSKYIQKCGRVSEDHSRMLLRQLASGLECLREKKLMHRDLKPANLLIENEGSNPENIVLKIADFGFARHIGAMEVAETLCGTPLYMAPEILEFKPYNTAAELWSVGAILYEMVTGKPPFKASNQNQLLTKIKNTGKGLKVDASMRQRLSAPCVALIEGLLRRNPKDRIPFEKFFKHPFFEKEKVRLKEESAQSQSPSTRDSKRQYQLHTKSGERNDYEASSKRKLHNDQAARHDSAKSLSGLSKQLLEREKRHGSCGDDKTPPHHSAEVSVESQGTANKSSTPKDYVVIDKPYPKAAKNDSSAGDIADRQGTQNPDRKEKISIASVTTIEKKRAPNSSALATHSTIHAAVSTDEAMQMFASRAKKALLVANLGEAKEKAHQFVETVQLYTYSVELFQKLIQGKY